MTTEGHSDDGPLPHAAAQLEGIVVNGLLRVGHFDPRQHVNGPLARLSSTHLLVQLDDLGDLAPHGAHRAHGRHRLLEHHGDLVASDGPHLLAVGPECGDVDDVGHFRVAVLLCCLVVQDLPLLDLAGRGNDAQQGERRHALATTALPNDPQRLSPPDLQVNAIHCPDDPLGQMKVGVQVCYVHEYTVVCHSATSHVT